MMIDYCFNLRINLKEHEIGHKDTKTLRFTKKYKECYPMCPMSFYVPMCLKTSLMLTFSY